MPLRVTIRSRNHDANFDTIFLPKIDMFIADQQVRL